jgi:hypothetical protein
MEEFEDLTAFQLRKLLVNTMIEKRGRDYALGWLSVAYEHGNRLTDQNRDFLIDQIRELRLTSSPNRCNL